MIMLNQVYFIYVSVLSMFWSVWKVHICRYLSTCAVMVVYMSEFTCMFWRYRFWIYMMIIEHLVAIQFYLEEMKTRGATFLAFPSCSWWCDATSRCESNGQLVLSATPTSRPWHTMQQPYVFQSWNWPCGCKYLNLCTQIVGIEPSNRNEFSDLKGVWRDIHPSPILFHPKCSPRPRDVLHWRWFHGWRCTQQSTGRTRYPFGEEKAMENSWKTI